MKDWFKARNIWGAAILSLPDEEAGKLVKALWTLTMTGEVVPIDGPGSGIYALMKMTLEQDSIREAEISEKRSMATAGIRRQKVSNDTPGYQMKSNDIKCNQMISSDDNKNKNKNKNKSKNQNKESESEFILTAEAADIQREHDQVLEAAQNAGFKSSPAERAGLLNLYAEHGLEKMLSGINECVTHAAPNLAYLTAVLKGTGKKKDATDIHGYSQRDYSGEQDKAFDRLVKMAKDQKVDARDVHGYEQRDYSGEQAEAIRRMMSDEWGSEGGVG